MGALLCAVWTCPAYASRGPTASQIRAAIRKAERSPDLWATVNTCNTRRYRDAIGIRGQMPSLGFKASLVMRVGVDYLASLKIGFKAVPHVSETVSLGTSRVGLEQGGVRFKFSPGSGYLQGSVTFEWKLGRRVIGRVTMKTSADHRGADFGDPPRFSAALCYIP